MKIAQIAPLMESVPPKLYGGTERVVSYLSEELVRQGHDVTLFASGDSVTSARLVACTDQAIRLNPSIRDHIPHYMIMLDKLRRSSHLFDVLHFHIDAFQLPLFRDVAFKTLTTLHGRQDLPDLLPLYRAFPDMPLVSISNAQREPIADASFAKTIHHGLPLDLLTPNYEARGGYLAFLGRISCEKRPDRAIAIATALGLPLKIAAKVDKVDESYFREVIAPLLDRPGVEFVGEIDDRGKTKFLGDALALLFPIDWPEPFGLVMIEAMACGTPVLGFRCGSVPEIIDDHITGRVVATVDEAIRVLPEMIRLDRRAVRLRFEERFSAARMAKDYVNVYRGMSRSAEPVLAQDDRALRSNVIALPRKNGIEYHAS
ncbi:Glycosyltransferase involved in cell wall bisynthesis [Rhizobiales bacterium GAS113]|jgi:glycosyltransferase involved in cell wall biosynthesis|nr:Glycosyltransferase involved in cell wall bisynthesis [Rhizobiales bacterium GAS113]